MQAFVEEGEVVFKLVDFDQSNKNDLMMGLLKEKFKLEKEKSKLVAYCGELIGKTICLRVNCSFPEKSSEIDLTHNFNVINKVDFKNEGLYEIKAPGSFDVKPFRFYMKQHLVRDSERRYHYTENDDCLSWPGSVVLVRRNDSEYSKCAILSPGCSFRKITEERLKDVDKQALEQIKLREDVLDCMILNATDESNDDIEMLFEKGKLLFEVDRYLFDPYLDPEYYEDDWTVYAKGEQIMNELMWEGELFLSKNDITTMIGSFVLSKVKSTTD